MMKTAFSRLTLFHYLTVLFWITLITAANHIIEPYAGYRAIGFIYLLLVTILSLIYSFGPVFVAALLSAPIWNYFFIPPKGTFHIHAPEDVMMVVAYFVVASVNGFLTLKIRQYSQKTHQMRLLQESEKLHQTLLNCISHELRTPLTAIVGAATTLQSRTQYPNSDTSSLLTEIISSSERLNHVFENLLDMTRCESGSIKPQLEWFDMTELLHFTMEHLAKFAASHRLHLISEKDSIYFYGDFNLLEHAFANIVRNAVSYSDNGSDITIRIHKELASIVISVVDRGPGIPLENMSSIFDKFYRLPGTPVGGLGLGLSIARNLVETHGGTITVKNNSDKGSTFTTCLPYREPPDSVKETTL